MKSSHVYSGSVVVGVVLYVIWLAISGGLLYIATKIVKYAWFN